MKTLTVFALTLFSVQTFAGSWNYSCESANGKVKLTREKLVIIEKENNGSIRDIIIKPYNDTINTGPNVDDFLVYKDSHEGNTTGDVTVKFTKLISDKEIEKEDPACAPGDTGGHGPGFTTNKKVFKATVKQYDEVSPVTLTCFETMAWAGNCHFDSEDN